MTRDRKIVENQGVPEYATYSDLPLPANFKGLAFVQDGSTLYKSDGKAWFTMATTSNAYTVKNEQRLAEIRTRLYAASQLGFTLNYLVAGDSTREIPKYVTIGTEAYYNMLLSKLNVTVFYSATAGMDAAQWISGKQTAFLAQISGSGANSIMEYSFGLNDHTHLNGDYAATKAQIKLGITSTLAAKADLAVLLVSPVKMNEPVAGRRISLAQIYLELAEELDLPLIDGYAVTKDIYNTTEFYADYAGSPHPNEFGGKRLVNHIIDSIVPITIRNLITYDDLAAPALSITNATKVIDHSWVNGVLTAGVNYRCLASINCKGSTMLTVSHQGNAVKVHCIDSGGSFIKTIDIDSVVAPNRKIFLPYNTASVGINLSSQGATYDALNDNVTVAFSYMSQIDINIGLERLPVYSF